MRVGHAVLGGTAGVVWLVLPVMTSGESAPVATKAGGTAASAPAGSAASAQEDQASGFQLILPVAALGSTAALAGYGYVRRIRRARTRTTPAGAPVAPPVPELVESDERAGKALVRADDRVCASREELDRAEARCRELTARAAAAGAVHAGLVERYGPAACVSVAGYAEQAKDRLVSATTHLHAARQVADRDEPDAAAERLRAAENAMTQAGVLVSGVERLAAALSAAEELLPAALTDAEAELSAAADALAAVRDSLTTGTERKAATGTGTYDPLDALHRVVRACLPLGAGRTGALSAAALLAAREAVSDADGFVAAHRDAVGRAARTHLAEAQRLLASSAPDELVTAAALAHRARALAERDVRRTAL